MPGKSIGIVAGIPGLCKLISLTLRCRGGKRCKWWRERQDVEEAIKLALTELDQKPEEVKIDVLSEGSRGVWGIGTEEARVRVSIPNM